jgi:hypothetical protein
MPVITVITYIRLLPPTESKSRVIKHFTLINPVLTLKVLPMKRTTSTGQIHRKKYELSTEDVPTFLKLTAEEKNRARVLVHNDCRSLAATCAIHSVLAALKAEWWGEFQGIKKQSDRAAKRARNRKAPTRRVT